jgi:hypothetical protein
MWRHHKSCYWLFHTRFQPRPLTNKDVRCRQVLFSVLANNNTSLRNVLLLVLSTVSVWFCSSRPLKQNRYKHWIPSYTVNAFNMLFPKGPYKSPTHEPRRHAMRQLSTSNSPWCPHNTLFECSTESWKENKVWEEERETVHLFYKTLTENLRLWKIPRPARLSFWFADRADFWEVNKAKRWKWAILSRKQRRKMSRYYTGAEFLHFLWKDCISYYSPVSTLE